MIVHPYDFFGTVGHSFRSGFLRTRYLPLENQKGILGVKCAFRGIGSVPHGVPIRYHIGSGRVDISLVLLVRDVYHSVSILAFMHARYFLRR